MKRLRIAASLALIGVLSITALALASSQFTQTANITLTAKKAGKPTGFKASLASSDPGAVQPQGLKVLTITFPAKTAFNFKSSAISRCKASDTEIKATGGKACPSKSRLGAGNAIANGAPVIPTIPENVNAYAGSNQIIFLLSPTGPSGQILVLHGKVQGNKMTTEVPVISAGGLNIVISSLNLSIKTIGSGKNAFVTAGTCSKGKFVVKSKFVYQTGSVLNKSSSSACTK